MEAASATGKLCADAPDYKEMSLKLKERCYLYQVRQQLSTEPSGEDGEQIPCSSNSKAADPKGALGQHILGGFPSRRRSRGCAEHEHCPSAQWATTTPGQEGIPTTEAGMVQVLKKELYDVRDVESLSEVEKRRKGNEKGKREASLRCCVFYEVEPAHGKKVDPAPTGWCRARALRGSEKLFMKYLYPFPPHPSPSAIYCF